MSIFFTSVVDRFIRAYTCMELFFYCCKVFFDFDLFLNIVQPLYLQNITGNNKLNCSLISVCSEINDLL